MTLYAAFGEKFAAYPDEVLVEENGRRWTYSEIDQQAGRLASRLIGLGLAPGERLLVQTEKSAQTLLLYLACLRVGGVYLPLNTDYTEAELGYFAQDAEPILVVCGEGSQGLFARIAGGAKVTALPDLFENLPDHEADPVQRGADDLAAILYTSGTTGKPKGAMLSNANLLSNARALVDLWRFTPEDRLIHALPIFHVHGLFVAVHCVILSGASMLFLSKFDCVEVIAAMPKSTVLMGVPTFYSRLLSDAVFTADAAQDMRLFISGSAPLSGDVHRAFEARCGHRVLERYGMTETGMLTSNPYDGERRAGFVGMPLPNVELRIAGAATGDGVPQGEVGIIEVRGPNIFSGYWRMPERTAQEFRDDGFFITGDMGLIDPAGYVQLVGREKDLVITGGLNVYPAEVEALLDDRKDIAEAAVIGVPHPDLGEAVVAVVRPIGAFDEQVVRAELREHLAGFKTPKRIIAIDALPRNAMGKIQKKLLREQYADLFAAE